MNTESKVLHVWRGPYRPQGTPEKPYAHTEEYVYVGTTKVVLTDDSVAKLFLQGYELYYPMRG